MTTIVQVRRATSYGFATVIWVGFALWMTGCAPSAPSVVGSSVAPVSASEAALAAAGRAVLACYSVPKCAAVAPKPQIKVAYDKAYTAVTSAQALADAGATPDMTATAAAMSVLQGLVAQLPPAS